MYIVYHIAPCMVHVMLHYHNAYSGTCIEALLMNPDWRSLRKMNSYDRRGWWLLFWRCNLLLFASKFGSRPERDWRVVVTSASGDRVHTISIVGCYHDTLFKPLVIGFAPGLRVYQLSKMLVRCYSTTRLRGKTSDGSPNMVASTAQSPTQTLWKKEALRPKIQQLNNSYTQRQFKDEERVKSYLTPQYVGVRAPWVPCATSRTANKRATAGLFALLRSVSS